MSESLIDSIFSGLTSDTFYSNFIISDGTTKDSLRKSIRAIRLVMCTHRPIPDYPTSISKSKLHLQNTICSDRWSRFVWLRIGSRPIITVAVVRTKASVHFLKWYRWISEVNFHQKFRWPKNRWPMKSITVKHWIEFYRRISSAWAGHHYKVLCIVPGEL